MRFAQFENREPAPREESAGYAGPPREFHTSLKMFAIPTIENDFSTFPSELGTEAPRGGCSETGLARSKPTCHHHNLADHLSIVVIS